MLPQERTAELWKDIRRPSAPSPLARMDELLASGGGWGDTAICIWDAETETHRRTLKGHAAYVGSLAFSPDGSTLGSGSYDGTVLLWDVSR